MGNNLIFVLPSENFQFRQTSLGSVSASWSSWCLCEWRSSILSPFRWRTFSSSCFSWLFGSWPTAWPIRLYFTHTTLAQPGYSAACFTDRICTFLDRFPLMKWTVSFSCHLFKKVWDLKLFSTKHGSKCGICIDPKWKLWNTVYLAWLEFTVPYFHAKNVSATAGFLAVPELESVPPSLVSSFSCQVPL